MVNPGFVPEPQEQQRAQAQGNGNGMAVAGLVLGLCAIVLCWIPFLNWMVALLGIIFGALGISRGNKVGRGKGMAIAGLICGIVGAALGTYLVVMAMRGLTEFVEKSQSIEARASMHSMEHDLKAYAIERGEFPKGTAGPTPAGTDCCSQPDHQCAAGPSDWNAPVWRDMAFEVFHTKTRYQYDYSSTDGKTFVAHAVGDADCDGEKAVWEMHGTIADGVPSIQLVEPSPGVR